MTFKVAIDGPAGAGKSTVARRVASELDLTYIDTGAMYRAVAWKSAQSGIDVSDEARLATLSETIRIAFSPLDSEFRQHVFVDEVDVTEAIRTPDISTRTSIISAIPSVRVAVVSAQRRIANAAPRGAVLEGRDIGTVVFPDAAVKIFLTASSEERARRRWEQLRVSGVEVPFESVLAEQVERDTRDSERAASPLVASPDAMTLNTDGLSIDEVVARITALCQTRLKAVTV
jgi:cytidylate kinase